MSESMEQAKAQAYDEMRAEVQEQARLLGMSGEREAALRAENAELKREIAEIKHTAREIGGPDSPADPCALIEQIAERAAAAERENERLRNLCAAASRRSELATHATLRAETAEARVAELEAIQEIAHVQVDDLGYLWLNLNGGEGCYKASVNITDAVSFGGSIVRGGVRQATEALRKLHAPKAGGR